MTEPVALLSRGNVLYIGLESELVEQPALRYPALIQLLSLPAQGQLAGQLGIQTLTVPVALPMPYLRLAPGEVVQPLSAEDAQYPPTRDFLPQYLALVERIKQAETAGRFTIRGR